ncbi:hypothetical protein K466DRAFT_321455 [Polyporus arcularius HHB13444]|uniref:Uncharacterized protein n=1 Tax=Polyporus arcularius HHB13444 TaxID=1314778 RepID=A0A5C3NYK1_9APHY|nr:hypothetical protein K466DRAFT_321455 [Polyporus arcularius HHB13444]
MQRGDRRGDGREGAGGPGGLYRILWRRHTLWPRGKAKLLASVEASFTMFLAPEHPIASVHICFTPLAKPGSDSLAAAFHLESDFDQELCRARRPALAAGAGLSAHRTCITSTDRGEGRNHEPKTASLRASRCPETVDCGSRAQRAETHDRRRRSPRAVKRAPSGVYRNSESRENTYEHIASGRARKQTYAFVPQVSSIPQAACRVERLANRRRVQPSPTTVHGGGQSRADPGAGVALVAARTTLRSL